MPRSAGQPDIYAVRGKSTPQRAVMTAAAALCLGAACWVLFGSAIARLDAWRGWNWRSGNEIRRVCLAIALAVYFLRLLCTQFVFLKRAVGWSEAGAVAPWLLVLYLSLAFAAGTNAAPFAAGGLAGCVLFVVGSWMNTYAEYARHVWKHREENRGRLYTQGLFRCVRHPNYLGDLISFSGLCLMTGRWPTVAIPLIMLAGFVFVNIPMLDAHLSDHYGTAFDAYAERTRKLIPFVY